jgi:hypothetical protein
VLTGPNVAHEKKMSTGFQGAVELGEHEWQQLGRRVMGGPGPWSAQAAGLQRNVSKPFCSTTSRESVR